MPATEGENTVEESRKDAVLALGAAIVAFALYWNTLCPTVFWYDSAEFVTAAHTLGIPHPPGYPLYTLVAHPMSYLPGNPARAINAFSALCAATAIGLVFLVARGLGAPRSGAGIAAAMVAVGPVFWFNSVVAEVYTPALATLLGVWLLILRGLARDEAKWLILAAGVAGLGLGFHLSIATCGLGLGLAVMGVGTDHSLRQVFSGHALARRARVAAGCIGAALAGACIFLWIPFRAAQNPALNFENPSSWAKFRWFLGGGNYRYLFTDRLDVAERVGFLGELVRDELSVVGIGLAVAGLAWLIKMRPLLGVAWLAAIAGNVWFFFDYMAHDAHVFFLPALVLVGVAIGPAFAWLEHLPRRMAPALVTLSAVVVVDQVRTSFPQVDLADFTEAGDWGDAVSEALPRDAVIINYTTPPEWKLDAVFASYYQLVLGRRPDVKVIAANHKPEHIQRMLDEGRDLFCYAPTPLITKHFVLREEAYMYRVVGPVPAQPRE